MQNDPDARSEHTASALRDALLDLGRAYTELGDLGRALGCCTMPAPINGSMTEADGGVYTYVVKSREGEGETASARGPMP